MLLQVGFKSLGYEMQEEKPAYDSISLLGKTIGFAHDWYRAVEIRLSCNESMGFQKQRT